MNVLRMVTFSSWKGLLACMHRTRHANDRSDSPVWEHGSADAKRPRLEGCRTRRVAYLEGWFVVPDARPQGVGRALISAAEESGRAQGCTEFASDTRPDNTTSAAAHRALGFSETGLVLCFRKDL